VDFEKEHHAMTIDRLESPIYGSEFYDAHSVESLRSARTVAPLILEWLSPRSVVDVGCGIGTWLSAFRELGVTDVLGIDGYYVDRSQLLIPESSFLPRDLTRPLEVGRRFDLVVSLEVAEHLPESSARDFVGSLTSLGDAVLFSAAIPRQGGTHHINEQWPDYWRDLFWEAGYEMLDCLRSRLWDDETISSSYRQNAFLYLRGEAKERYRDLRCDVRPLPLRLVHPGVFEYGLSRRHRPTLRPLLKALPWAVSLAIRSRLGPRNPR
jgi:SAM-dependent methyltransferase